MIVVSLSNVPPKLRGFLTKYLWEISTGVYAGKVNARIREALWKRITENTNEISKAIMVFPSNNEQGFDFYTEGSSWIPVDFDGLKLIMRPDKNKRDKQNLTCDSRSLLEHSYVVLDIETTGLDIDKDRILEIGAIKITDGYETERFEKIINIKVPSEIIELTGITQDQADEGVDIIDAIMMLGEFINGVVTIGYNIKMFDVKFLKKECARNNIPFPVKKVVDVFDLARKAFPSFESYKLRDVAAEKGITIDNNKHRAITDCLLCNEVYKMCLEIIATE